MKDISIETYKREQKRIKKIEELDKQLRKIGLRLLPVYPQPLKSLPVLCKNDENLTPLRYIRIKEVEAMLKNKKEVI